MVKDKNNNITVLESINKDRIKSQIYEIRGFKVMLDSDIAKYFDVETGALNRAMKRNIKRFPLSFCLQLTNDEIENLKCQFGISSHLTSYGGRRTAPFVYTEQGVAMLTSTLHSDKAIIASIQIIEAFVEMTHYLQQSKQLLSCHDFSALSNRQDVIEADIKEIRASMVTKANLSDLMKLFDNGVAEEEILILNGQPFKADLAYQNIFKKAKKNIIVIDDYIDIKTLYHLTKTNANIKITIISDNKRKTLRLQEYTDFMMEYPNIKINFIKSSNKVHDRYIILDNKTIDMKVYHCGASLKDSGKKITTITQISDIHEYKVMIKDLLINSPLILK